MLSACSVQPATHGPSLVAVAAPVYDGSRLAALCFAAQERAAEPITIEYRQNRATIIHARLFHESDPFTFKVGPT